MENPAFHHVSDFTDAKNEEGETYLRYKGRRKTSTIFRAIR